jgi:CBS domain-containing membrane protein
MAELQVADLMTEKVVFARENDRLDTVYDVMAENHIRHIPVVNKDQEVIGLISQRDLVGAALFTDQSMPLSQVRDLLREIKVSEVMIRGAETTEPDESLREAGLKMLENKFGCLPVVEGQTLIGILTEADFVQYVCNLESESAKRLGSRAKSA